MASARSPRLPLIMCNHDDGAGLLTRLESTQPSAKREKVEAFKHQACASNQLTRCSLFSCATVCNHTLVIIHVHMYTDLAARMHVMGQAQYPAVFPPTHSAKTSFNTSRVLLLWYCLEWVECRLDFTYLRVSLLLASTARLPADQ